MSSECSFLGKPGAGKTTFLKYLTLQACAGKVITSAKKRPIFVSLKEWIDSGTEELIPFLAQQFKICEFPKSGLYRVICSKRGLRWSCSMDWMKSVPRKVSVPGSSNALTRFAEQYDKAQILHHLPRGADRYSFTEFTSWRLPISIKPNNAFLLRSGFKTSPRKAAALPFTEFEKPQNKGLTCLG